MTLASNGTCHQRAREGAPGAGDDAQYKFAFLGHENWGGYYVFRWWDTLIVSSDFAPDVHILSAANSSVRQVHLNHALTLANVSVASPDDRTLSHPDAL